MSTTEALQAPDTPVSRAGPATMTLEDALKFVVVDGQMMRLGSIQSQRCGFTWMVDELHRLLRGSDVARQQADAAIADLQDQVRVKLEQPLLEIISPTV